MLPNLFIPGAAKSGTSALHEYLNQHPQVFMSAVKEPHFFSRDSNFRNGTADLDEYLRLFANGKDMPVRGESSTGYMIFPRSIDRIKQYVSDPKFIFILRNPIDRAYSHYWWIRGRGFEERPFREALIADLNEEPDPLNRVKGFGGYRYYYQVGCYAKWIAKFIESFGRDTILIVLTEQLYREPLNTVNLCFEFLGVAPLEEVEKLQTNRTVIYKHIRLYRLLHTARRQIPIIRLAKRMASERGQQVILLLRTWLLKRVGHWLRTDNQYPQLSPEDRSWLAALYANEIDTLRRLTGLYFHEWLRDFPFSVTE